MELEFRLAESDVLDYHSRHSPAAREIRRRQNYGHAVLLTVFGLVFWFFGEAAVAGAIIVLGPLWVLWWPARGRRLVRQEAAAFYSQGSSPLFDGPHVLRIDEADLVYITPRAEHRLPFAAVQRIASTPDYLFVHMSRVAAVVVPRRRVTRGDVDIFVRQLQSRVGGHRR